METEKPLYSGSKGLVLAVDDDAVGRILLDRNLRDLLPVHSAASGQEALDFLATHNDVALILLDYRMPGMNGLEVVKQVKENPATADIPIIMLTSVDDAKLETEALNSGVSDFLRKPFIPAVMRRRVQNILNYAYLRKNLTAEVKLQTRRAEEERAATERLFEEMILALAQAIDAKDPYTHGHSQRVAEYSAQIAKEMGDSPQAVKLIYYMGLLHDVGKIGIPVEIINKPSKLTDEEYATIKSHTVIGAEVLKPIKERPELAIGAHYHHERYDGKGYPEGLAGEEIPREARIIAVADAYDAMTSRRSYRAGLPTEKVYNEIKRCNGIQFDPQFAEVMLKMMEKDLRGYR
ncbi:MAG: HD domain-containing protein [Selenomonadaceae bacterium]|nr:HD domain-containing protein [Selenomonadaceae bacterium]